MDAPTNTTPDPAPAVPPPPSGWPGPRELRRRPDAGPIAGVCAGLAEYFNVDPVIVRIAAVALAVSGPGVFVYLLAWIFVPAAAGPSPGPTPTQLGHGDRGRQILGVLLLALAFSVLWGDWWSPARHWVFPLGLMALGAWLLLRREPQNAASPPSPPAPGARWDSGPSDLATLTDTDASADVSTAGDTPGRGTPATPWAIPTPNGPDEATERAARRGLVGPIVLGTLLVWGGLARLTGVTLQTGLAVGLLIIGIGMVVGGSRLLLLPALLVGGALAVTAVVDIPLSGPMGQQVWAPQRVADIDPPYEMSVGEGTLDLSAIDLPAGDQLSVEASVGIGHLVVLVPTDVAVDVDTRVGAGESRVLGLNHEGVGLSTDQFDEEGATGGTLVLHLRAGMGQIEVHRSEGRRVPAGTTTTVIR